MVKDVNLVVVRREEEQLPEEYPKKASMEGHGSLSRCSFHRRYMQAEGLYQTGVKKLLTLYKQFGTMKALQPATAERVNDAMYDIQNAFLADSRAPTLWKDMNFLQAFYWGLESLQNASANFTVNVLNVMLRLQTGDSAGALPLLDGLVEEGLRIADPPLRAVTSIEGSQAPNPPQDQLRVTLLSLRADVRLKTGDMRGSLKDIQLALSMEPDNEDLHWRAGICQLHFGEYRDCITCMRNFLRHTSFDNRWVYSALQALSLAAVNEQVQPERGLYQATVFNLTQFIGHTLATTKPNEKLREVNRRITALTGLKDEASLRKFAMTEGSWEDLAVMCYKLSRIVLGYSKWLYGSMPAPGDMDRLADARFGKP
eukprot:TRINITY_DN66638_c2_g1_i1.p1 TRINITY_DN66638_c2_g1~~TRINITY_DN66638_c2_g1_i1.p1  ORF type:complete len:421 (+),score=16.67 TRINITY_DN66638_c2_g1_i1:154-1263(+)